MGMESASQLEQRLAAVRGNAPRRSPSVRALAAYASNVDCKLATLGFTARVDFDRLLTATAYQPSFGQSPFAFARGLQFERMLAEHGYAAILGLLREQKAFNVNDARVVNVREMHADSTNSMQLRAQETRALIARIVANDSNAPNLIDGAVLETPIGGIPARFEADAVATKFGDLIHAGEVKSFPVVDERADPDKLGAALDQVSIYILLIKRLVEELGADPAIVSTRAMLITPKNVGMTPTLTEQDVTKRVQRVNRLLSTVPEPMSILDQFAPDEVNFGLIADRSLEPSNRIDTLHRLADRVGTHYRPTCLVSCGNARFCREQEFKKSSPCVTGPEAIRLLPGIESLQRAAELVEGHKPTDNEKPAAQLLARAGRLHDVASATASTRKRSSSNGRHSIR
jgi:hypothetical protein